MIFHRMISSSPFNSRMTEEMAKLGRKKDSFSFKKAFIYSSLFGGVFYSLYNYGAPDINQPDTIVGRLSRAFSKLSTSVKAFNEPAFSKLLPEPYRGPNAKPYTLVIDLDRFLVCHIWDPTTSRWRIAKRPGVDLFLFYMAHMYEVVVYSKLSQFDGDMIMEKLDPLQFVTFRLYRFATKYKDGKYIKDLSRLNREMSNVVVMGHDPSYLDHSDNFIQIAPWDGDDSDHTLLDSIDFLETLAMSNIPDLRNAIRAYRSEGHQDILSEFDKRQRDTYETMREIRLQSESSILKRTMNYLFVGGQSPPRETTDEQYIMTGLIPYEDHRQEIQKQRRKIYETEIQRIEKEVKQQMEKTKEHLAKHKSSLFDLFTKGPPPPQSS